MWLGYLSGSRSWSSFWDDRSTSGDRFLLIVFMMRRFVSIVRWMGVTIFGLVELRTFVLVYLVVDNGMLWDMRVIVSLGKLVGVISPWLLV